MNQAKEFESRVIALIKASITAKETMLNNGELISTVAKVSEVLVQALKQGNKALFFGNGGSAADAQHLAAEFVGRFAFDRPALPALALSVNSSSVTAIGNDYGFDLIFSRQLEALGRPGDVAIGISTSGNSPNVINAMVAARKMKLHTVALTGASGGTLRGKVDHCICVPSNETPRIQEGHILVGHIISELVESEIFKKHGQASAS